MPNDPIVKHVGVDRSAIADLPEVPDSLSVVTPPHVTREVVRQAGLPDAACGVRSADGRSCVARVQRYYLRRRAERGG